MSTHYNTVITPPVQEHIIPVKNALDALDVLFRSLHLAIQKSYIPGTIVERPLSERAEIAELYHAMQKGNLDIKDEEKVYNAVSDLDNVYRQFLNQGEIKTELPKTGEQLARYTRITPPKKRKERHRGKPPIVLLPGVSNDLECVETLATELPLLGREVIVIGFPESYMGYVTPAFAEAVVESPTYASHVIFYKHAISQLTEEFAEIELWGFSTGSPIISQILHDESFQKKTKHAVLICPASSVQQTMKQLTLGIIHEYEVLFKRFTSVPKYVWTIGRKQPDDPVQKKLKKQIIMTLLKRVATRLDLWHDARVKENGRIIVVSSDKDHITKSSRVFRNDQKTLQKINQYNPQLTVMNIPNGLHSTPLVDPKPVIEKVFQLQE